MADRKPSRDHLDDVQAQWHAHMSGVDTEPMAVVERIILLARFLQEPIEAALKPEDIDRAGFDVLAVLRRSGPPFVLSPTELYTTLMLSSSGLTSRLARLEKAELIYRAHSKIDGRSQLVALTRKGRATVEAALRSLMKAEAELVGSLDRGDHQALAGLLRKLAVSLPVAD